MQSTRCDLTFLEKYAHLFFMDIEHIVMGERIGKYEKKEPGFCGSMLDGYLYAFSERLDHQLSSEFIKSLHGKLLKHAPNKKPGVYRNTPVFVPMAFPDIQIGDDTAICLNANATEAGLRQFVQQWFIEKEKPIHFLHFKSNTTDIYFLNFKNPPSNSPPGLYIQIVTKKPGTNAILDIKMLSCHEHREFLEKLIYDNVIKQPFQNFINFASKTDLERNGFTETIAELNEQCMNEICARYNKDILEANTEDEKLNVIVKCVQDIDQLHPFLDGRIPLVTVLLNRLLREEGLPLTLMYNPHRFDCRSREELVTDIKHGQQHFKTLLSGHLPAYEEEGHVIKYQEEILPVKPELLREFLDVLEGNTKQFGLRK